MVRGEWLLFCAPFAVGYQWVAVPRLSSRTARGVACRYHRPYVVDHQASEERQSQLSATLRSQLVEDGDVVSALRVVADEAGSSHRFEEFLKSLVPDDAMIRRIVSAASGSSGQGWGGPRARQPKLAGTSSFEGCVELMARERWLDAQDALSSPECATDDPELAGICAVLEAVCKHELGCPKELEAVLARPPRLGNSDLAAAVTDLARGVAARGRGDGRAAYGHALASAATVSAAGPTGAFEALKQLARRNLEQADGLIAQSEQRSSSTDQQARATAATSSSVATEGDEMRARSGNSTSLQALLDLVGLKAIKTECVNMKEAVELDLERGDDPRDKQHSVLLTGNPGTGKTTVGRLYADLLAELGVIPKPSDPKRNNVVEVTGSQLVRAGADEFEKLLKTSFEDDGKSALKLGDKVMVPSKRGARVGDVCYLDPAGTYDVHFGDGVEIKVRRDKIKALDRMGGALFIDEAYQLDPKSNAVGRQILDLLATAMDDKKGALVVILAGYPKRIDDLIAEHNDGALRSRFRKRFDFDDFEDDELAEIMRRELAGRPKYRVVDDKIVRIAARRLGKLRGSHGFGNARAVQHLVETAFDRQTARVLSLRRDGLDPDIFELNREDFLGERSLNARTASKALADLRNLWGLENVKDSVDRLLKMVETNIEREELELPLQEVSLNRVFLGNPGTG